MYRKWIRMSKRHVKIKWPFKKGEKAELIWIGDPFRYDNKIMLYAYCRANRVTKEIGIGWGRLPFLAIQCDYSDGVSTTSLSPQDARSGDITTYRTIVKYFDKPWKRQGNNVRAT